MISSKLQGVSFNVLPSPQCLSRVCRYTKALDSIKNLRKDRVADLKAEKERLIGLSREKAHADKLKSRIADVTSTIAEKEVSYEETKHQYEAIVEANQKFYDYASKFRELYIRVEGLQKEEARLQADIDEAKLNLQEVSGAPHRRCPSVALIYSSRYR
jgi:DNA repair protein RAD50